VAEDLTFLLKSLDLGKVAADNKSMTKLIAVKTSTASVCTTQVSEVTDSGCKVKAVQFLNDPSHEVVLRGTTDFAPR